MPRKSNLATRKTKLSKKEVRALAERLRSIVNETFGSINEFVRATGIPRTTVSGWLRSGAPQPPSAAHLATIARVGRVNLNWLLVGAGEPHVLTAVEPYGDGQPSASPRDPPASIDEAFRRMVKLLVRTRRSHLSHVEFEGAWDLLMSNLDYSVSTPNRAVDLALLAVLNEFDLAVRGQGLYARVARIANTVGGYAEAIEEGDPSLASRYRRTLDQLLRKSRQPYDQKS